MNEHTISYKGGNIYFYTIGNISKEALFLLHPAFADHHIFTEQYDLLAEDYYMISMDFVGHGKSSIKGSSANMGDMPDVMKLIMEILNVERAHIVGVSIGSLVAQGFADRYRDMVKSVTIVGGYSIHRDNDHIKKAQAKEMGKWLKYILFNLEKFKAYIVESSSYSQRCKEVFAEAVSTFKRGNLRGMNGMNKIMRDDEKPLSYPLLVIAGAYDLQLAKDAGSHLEEIEKNAEYHEIANAGHCANIDQPQAFNSILTSFVDQY